jgi:chromosome segregation ATPase
MLTHVSWSNELYLTFYYFYAQLHGEISSLKAKVRTKDSEKGRLRNASKDEEDRLSEIDKRFSNDVSNLRQLTTQIESYVDSNKGHDLDRIKEKISNLAQRTKEKEAELAKIEPELDQLNKEIDDQLRHKKLIQENIDALAAGEKIKDLTKDLGRLEEDIGQVEGIDTYAQALSQCQARLSELVEIKARHEGRRGGIVDQIRLLKVRSRARTTPY